ncbi:MAG: SIR2 family protein [Saprospiraceae bacterium]|nr:SIR2 family protein [Saprospiraceae bacterium]
MNWHDLLEDLEEEKAILFLGPELVQLDGKSLGLHVREQLHRENPDDILHHYQRDGIFLFRDDTAKVSAQKKIKRLYKQLPPDETLLQRIASLPFHLIISLTPDTHLLDTFEQCGLTPTFHYFRSTEPFDALPKPEKGKPLIYNLFGLIGDDESLVLDYDDVFNLMKDCLSTGLPLKLNERLVRANTFIFLGFDFEKWHTQMLLRFLSQRPGISKFAIEGEKPAADDTSTFLVEGFKVRFEKGERDDENFIDALYRRCDEQKMLRELSNQFSDKQVAMMRLAQSGKLTTALDELLQLLTQPDDIDQATLLKARLGNLETNKPQTDSRDYRVEWNAIAYGIINLVKKLKP